MSWTIQTQYEGEHKSPHGHVKWPEGDKTDFEAFHNEAVDLLDKLLDIDKRLDLDFESLHKERALAYRKAFKEALQVAILSAESQPWGILSLFEEDSEQEEEDHMEQVDEE